ncbi:2OG-Fe(II) oxygenase [Polaribacter tangerinus]|uniref:2OG-Fe(II) oxygenase n=1 Tax=Polaribacter tangerinus TaxID=1920034 RepID=UPI000B4BE025|nr:2OG-Fe(II) oxygenase [Polaribacter tangerinus]
MDRKEIANLIYLKLTEEKEQLKAQFKETKDKIGYFYVDDLLPVNITKNIYDNFPSVHNTVARKSLREKKYTAYQLNKYGAILEEVTYAFQDKKVVNLVADICGVEEVFADENLYAGGLSLMGKNNFLNPHLDNSHDKDRNRWRILNLLYYVTPNWKLQNGGNLELWPEGIRKKPVTIVSKYNRLVVMATHQNSWHSVSKVQKNLVRCCVSNYYFSNTPLNSSDKFHVTTFRGRKSELVKDVFLQLDNFLRTSIRKIFKKGIRENPHQYKK